MKRKYILRSKISQLCPECFGAGEFDLWEGRTECEKCDGCGYVAREQFWTRVRTARVHRVAA